MNQGQNAEFGVETEPAVRGGNDSAGIRQRAGQATASGGSQTQQRPEPVSAAPERPGKQSELPASPHTGTWAGEALLQMGRAVPRLAITVIVVLSGGLGVLIYGQLRESAANMLGDSSDLLSGFGFLMLLTIGYLVAKHWTTTRDQRRLIGQLLEEEAIARARRLNPITQFHHPEVCRDILLQQASHAARLHAPVALLELTISDLAKLSLNPDTRPLSGELVRQIRRLCRSTDALLRWTPDSFLLVLPEVPRDELLAISHRILYELEQWLQERFEAGNNLPTLRWRGISSKSLDASGDILLEAQRLLENESGGPGPQTEARRPNARREKSIGLTLDLEIRGADAEGNSFQEKIVTERVASDRLWFVWKRHLVEGSSLTVVGPEGSFEEEAVLIGYTDRGGEQLAEVEFVKAPEQWVVRV